MLGYVTLGSNDLAKTREFYDGLMPVIGAKRIMDMLVGEQLPRIC